MFIHLLMNIWVASMSWLLQIVLQWILESCIFLNYDFLQIYIHKWDCRIVWWHYFRFLGNFHTVLHGNPWWHISKESACSAGDMRLISGSERSHGEANGNPRGRKTWTWLGNETTAAAATAILFSVVAAPTVQEGSFFSCVALLDGGFQDWSSLEVSVSSQSWWSKEEATARDRFNHNGRQALCFKPSADLQVTLWKMRSLEESKHWLHFTWVTASWLALYQFWRWFHK